MFVIGRSRAVFGSTEMLKLPRFAKPLFSGEKSG
jgi:hypothetical protein